MDFDALAVVGPEGLALAGPILGDHGIGRIQNGRRAPIVLLQTENTGPLVSWYSSTIIYWQRS